MARVVSDFGRKGNVKRRSDALRILEFIQSRGKATSIEIGQAFPELTKNIRVGIMQRLRSAGLAEYQIVVVKGVTTRRWRAV